MTDLKILIVEDDIEGAQLLQLKLKYMLKKSNITIATDGFEALDVLREDAFDLVMTDYMMPGMDGLELIEAIRKLSPNTEIVLNTAFASNAIEQLIEKAQIKHFLRKPMETESIRLIMDKVLESVKAARKQRSNMPLRDSNGVSNAASNGSLNKKDSQNVTRHLDDLRLHTNASCCFLVDEMGYLLAQSGGDQQLPVTVIASVTAANALATTETSLLIGNPTPFYSTIREGPNYNMAIYGMDDMRLLGIIFSTNVKIGLVQHYARNLIPKLRKS